MIQNNPWIMTFTGRHFHPFNPDPDDLDILDIAHALSNICRFGGHSNRFYSVAEHSVIVSILCPMHLRLAGLLHDAAEAYLGDVPTPLKTDWYHRVEENLLKKIFEKFKVPDADEFDDAGLVRAMDQQLLFWEAEIFKMRPLEWDTRPLVGWGIVRQHLDGLIHGFPPTKAEEIFLKHFNYLNQL